MTSCLSEIIMLGATVPLILLEIIFFGRKMSGYYFCVKASKLLSDQHTPHSHKKLWILFFLIVCLILKSATP